MENWGGGLSNVMTLFPFDNFFNKDKESVFLQTTPPSLSLSLPLVISAIVLRLSHLDTDIAFQRAMIWKLLSLARGTGLAVGPARWME